MPKKQAGPQNRVRASSALIHTLSPLKPYLDDEKIYEIRINTFGQVVCATTEGKRIVADDKLTEDFLIKKLLNALASDNHLTPKAINNFLLPCGSRCVFLVPPAVVPGTIAIAIRKHMEISKTLEELAAEGRFSSTKNKLVKQNLELRPFEEKLKKLLLDRNYIDFLRLAVRNKQNIAVCGSTGSGKTVLTRSLVKEIPKEERIILLEDVHEVHSGTHDEVVYLQYGEGTGRISPTEALKACMRLSPNRILMTELRDSAAWDFLAGANTAHPGTVFSTHADDAASAFSRIADLVKASDVGRGLDYNLILKRIMTTLDVVIYMENWNIKEVLYDPEHKKKLLMETTI